MWGFKPTENHLMFSRPVCSTSSKVSSGSSESLRCQNARAAPPARLLQSSNKSFPYSARSTQFTLCVTTDEKPHPGIHLALLCSTKSKEICHGTTMEPAAPTRSVSSISTDCTVTRGLDPQPCRSRRLGTGNLRSRYPGDGKAAGGQQTKGWLSRF